MQTVTALRHERLMARDGHAGALVDVYFDDLGWQVRYLVVRTGWLGGQVLVVPAAVDRQRSTAAILQLTVSRQEVKAAPSAETDLPVWRQRRLAEAMRMGYPYYWSDLALSGYAGTTPLEAERQAYAALARSDRHLRSVRALVGCRVLAQDGPIGRVSDFVIDERSWSVPRLVADAHRWQPGGRVEVPTALVAHIDLESHKIGLSAPRAAALR
jgi:hypothetical protein